MANDEFDNARTDKAMLEQLRSDPRERLVDTICHDCKGSGLDLKLTVWTEDEWNPAGYWEEVPCDECHGSGLSTGVDNAIQNGVFAERDLKHAHELLTKATEGLTRALARLQGIPRADRGEGYVEGALGALEDELTELLQELDPEPPEEN